MVSRRHLFLASRNFEHVLAGPDSDIHPSCLVFNPQEEGSSDKMLPPDAGHDSPSHSLDARMQPPHQYHASAGASKPESLPVIRAAKKGRTDDHISVLDLFDHWSVCGTLPLTEHNLVAFRAYCESDLVRRGIQNASRLFTKRPKAIVGTQLSRIERANQRGHTITPLFLCPLAGCMSQCTRKHNLNRECSPASNESLTEPLQ